MGRPCNEAERAAEAERNARLLLEVAPRLLLLFEHLGSGVTAWLRLLQKAVAGSQAHRLHCARCAHFVMATRLLHA